VQEPKEKVIVSLHGLFLWIMAFKGVCLETHREAG
jgi:hypothetical protein